MGLLQSEWLENATRELVSQRGPAHSFDCEAEYHVIRVGVRKRTSTSCLRPCELEPASLEEMLDTVPGDGGEFARYGLGIAEMDSFLGIVPSPCGSAWGHLGLMPGCTCAALSTRDGARQAVLMTSGPINEAFGERMWDLFCG